MFVESQSVPQIFNDTSFYQQDHQPVLSSMPKIPGGKFPVLKSQGESIRGKASPLMEVSSSKLNSMSSKSLNSLNNSSNNPSKAKSGTTYDFIKPTTIPSTIYELSNKFNNGSFSSISSQQEEVFTQNSSCTNLEEPLEYGCSDDFMNTLIDDDEDEDDSDFDFLTEDDEHDEIHFVDSFGFYQPPFNSQVSQKLQLNSEKFATNEPAIEKEERFDPIMVSEYSSDFFADLNANELRYQVDPIAIINVQQGDFNWDDRKNLIQWVIKLHHRFRMTLETLYLTVNIIDRFLGIEKVIPENTELVGATALFIGAKMEEVHPPPMRSLLKLCDDKFDASTLRQAEAFIIKTLNFELNYAGPLSYLRRISKADWYDYQTRTFAKYFLEITLLDYKFIGAPKSWLAVGATYFAKKLLYPDSAWTDEHVFYGGYTEEQLIPLMEVLRDSCVNFEEHHKLLYWKYSDKKHSKCSIYTQQILMSQAESSGQ